MRKHFLILMLMALLPLAGWAADPFKVGNAAVYAIKAISNGELVYNKSNFAQTAWQIKYQTAENGEWLDLTSGYDLEYYASEDAATAMEHPVITNADDYWLGIKPAAGSTTCSGTLAADKRFKFTIKQAPLNITIANGEKNYGDETPDWQWEVAEGTQFAPGDNKTNVAINIVATAKEGDNLNWGGTHTYASVTATEANGNYKVTVTNAATLTLKVNKADLVFKIGTEGGEDFVKNYYELESSLTFNVTNSNVVITGARNGETITPVYTTPGKISYTYNLAKNRDAAANAKTDGTLFSTAEGANKDYKISFSGIELNETDARNYNITYEDRFVHIKQIEIKSSDTKFAFTPGATNFTYTGEKQEPTNHTITYKWGNNNSQKIPLTKGVDYDFAYKLSGSRADPINASSEPGVDNPTKYAVTIVAATGDNAKKNFTVADEGVAMTTFDFPIYKKQLDILVNPQKKEYTGAVQTFDKKFTITGFVDADKEKTVENLDVEPVPATNNANTVTKNVGKYFQQVKITESGNDASKLTWTEGEQAKEQLLTLNYSILKLTSGYFEITQKAVTVGAKDNKTITYGDELPTAKALSENTMTGLFNLEGVVEDDLNTVKGLLKLGLKTQYNTTGETPVAIPDKDYYTEATTYTGCWVITEDTDHDTNGLLKNYKITKNDKDFIINKAGFTMMAVQDQKEYNGQALTAADFAYVAYSGSTPVELPEGVTVEYEVLDPKTGEYTQTFPSAVGEYTYRVKVKPEYASGNFSSETKDIANPTATFTITPKTIYIQVQNVSLHEGDDETILNKYAKADYVPGVDADGNTIVAKPWTIGNDKLVLVYNFTEAVTNSANIWNGETKKLMYSSNANDNKPTDAVTVRLATKADFEEGGIFAGKKVNLLQNDNYVIAETDGVTMGQLFIHQGVFTTFDVAAVDYTEQLETATTAASQSGATGKNVRFKNTQYILPAGQWSTLVLPFDITPLEFCNMTGIKQYAIFNKLTSANASTNVVRFSLEQEKLPANKPFLVKAPQEIVLDNVEFTSRFVKYDETPTATVSQAKFIGSYVDVENIEGGANKMWWDKRAGNFVKATNGGVAKAFTNYCFHAYLVLDSSFSADANVRILVEEADGTVTAISNIDAEGVAVPAEGWYTINGVKLQGAPTQKGIYINNGKKIVVK